MAKLDLLEKYGPKAKATLDALNEQHIPKHLKSGFVYRDQFGNETTIEIYDRTRARCHQEWLKLWITAVFLPSTELG